MVMSEWLWVHFFSNQQLVAPRDFQHTRLILDGLGKEKGLTKINLIHPLILKWVQVLLILTDAFLISFKISSDRAIKIYLASFFLLIIPVPSCKQQVNILQISSRKIHCKYNNTPKIFSLAKSSLYQQNHDVVHHSSQ